MRVSRDLNCLIIFARKCLSPSNSDERWPHIIISIWFGRSLQLTLFSEKFGPLFFGCFGDQEMPLVVHFEGKSILQLQTMSEYRIVFGLISHTGLLLLLLAESFLLLPAICGRPILLAWVSGVSGEKGKDGGEKERESWRRETPDKDAFTGAFHPTQHDSIPSNQNLFRSLGCQLHLSKIWPKINLTLRSGRDPVLYFFVLLRFRFFLKPPMRSFRILVL